MQIVRLNGDYRRIVNSLRRHGRLPRLSARESVVVTRSRDGRAQTLQISPLAVELLDGCDGHNAIDAIVRAFEQRHPEFLGIPGSKAALAGLELLRRQRLIRMPPSLPVATQPA